ncbi:MAG TPA: cytochrome c [Anaerolineae bacterium]|nr:cytochrome c [Anaerolineae bacterium]HIP70879.1 cytochrome c [Anaerolineae bacterium]
MTRQTKRAFIILGMLILPLVAGLLFTYQIIKIPVPTDMADSPAVLYQAGPRLAAPAGAVSIAGQPLVVGSLPENPIPADEVSLQRGEILYALHCALCHGESGMGDGPMVPFYEEYEADAPPDITGSNIGNMFDGALFRIITQGRKTMPPLAENLTIRERWDVVNYVRSLEAAE